MTKDLILLTAVLTTVALPQDAAAAPIYWAQASVQVFINLGGGVPPIDTGQVLGSDDSGELSAADSTVFGSGAAVASVTDAELHAFATGTGATHIPGPGATSGGGMAIARYFDTLTPVSTSIPAGSEVLLQATWQLGYSLSGSGCTDLAQVYAGIIFSGAATAGANKLLQDSTCASADFEHDGGAITAVIGQEFGVELFLYATASANGAATADAANTMRLILTPMGDFALDSASGNRYLADSQNEPVPEPGSLVLLASGLSLLARRLRVRSRRTQCTHE